MDWKKAFTYMFLDKEFPKICTIGVILVILGNLWRLSDALPKKEYALFFALISIILITAIVVNIIFFGFSALLIKNSNSNTEKILPDWERDFSLIWKLGIKLVFASLICIIFLLAIIGIVIGLILWGISIFSTSPPSLLVAVCGITLLTPFAGLVLLTILLFAFLEKAFIINFVKTNSILTFFKIPSAIEIAKSDIKSYLLMILTEIGLIIAGGMGVFCLVLPVALVCALLKVKVIGIIIGLIIGCIVDFYVQLVVAGLNGQYYKKHEKKIAAIRK